jgi:dTMP kinase
VLFPPKTLFKWFLPCTDGIREGFASRAAALFASSTDKRKKSACSSHRMGDVQLPLGSHTGSSRKTLRRGAYITFEGPSCSGKDVQLALLQTRLQEEGYPIITTRQPGGTMIGKQIRQTLLHPDLRGQFHPHAESLLYWADRAQHHAELVKPAIAAGSIVLGSRDFDSSIAYQSYGRGLDLAWMQRMRELVVGSFAPHRTIMLMVDKHTFVQRSVHRMQESVQDRNEIRIEQGAMELFERIVEGYEELMHEEPHRFICIDAKRSIQDVHEDVYAAIKEVFAELE